MDIKPLTVLLVGSGGREHALAWKIAASPLVSRLVAAPGNPGVSGLCETRKVGVTDVPGMVALAREIAADLVIIGPESAVDAGLADALSQANIPCFGPSRLAGQLESSKAFTKAFCDRHGLPTAETRPGQARQGRQGSASLGTARQGMGWQRRHESGIRCAASSHRNLED